MRSWVLTGEPGMPLRLEDRPEPELGPGEVRVRLRAASLNYRDLIVAGQPPRPGLVPLSDGAGEVAEVAPDVRDLRAGDRVAGGFFADWASGPARHANLASALGGDLDGVLSETAVFPASAVAKIPGVLTFAEAATFPCAAVTAWHALVGCPSPAGAGDTVLALGSGGVAMFALQIARLRGARFIGTSSSEAKRERLRALGADVVIDYAATPLWGRDVQQATGGRGADFVVETGGAATLEQSLEASARGGCVTLVGVVSGRAATADAGLIQSRELTLRSIYVGPLTMLHDAMRAFADHGVRPVIDRSFGFGDAPAAFDYLRDARHVGKVVIVDLTACPEITAPGA
jgi:NADPH:quinone reductase-like Zn-dependent oxidoreductase